MAKPLNLFIKPDQTSNQYSNWEFKHSYGWEQTPGDGWMHTHILLHNKNGGTGELFAASSGILSIYPPVGAKGDPLEKLSKPQPGTNLPATVDLYLHFSPFTMQNPLFKERVKALMPFEFKVLGFAYINVETASLEPALADLLDTSIFPPRNQSTANDWERSHIVESLVRGYLGVNVTAGHAIGKAAVINAAAGLRQVGFYVVTDHGPIDPVYFYDWMIDYVQDGQAQMDSFRQFAVKAWPLFDSSHSVSDTMLMTTKATYPMPVLEAMRAAKKLTAEQWRKVGDNQKDLYIKRLKARAGHAASGSTEPPFEFDDADWQNIFQLEAVAQFYLNYSDPWKANAVPLEKGAQGYQTVDLICPTGEAATIDSSNNRIIHLDGTLDLSRVLKCPSGFLYDTILLENDTSPQNGLFRIEAVDVTNRTITLEAGAAPTFSRENQSVYTSPWKINLRPVLVLIDCFGARVNGSGAAQADAGNPNVITLDIEDSKLKKVNKYFDTIYFPSDNSNSHNPRRTYRIIDKDINNKTVTLDAAPDFAGGSSSWQIPAGVSGQLPKLQIRNNYTLGPDYFNAATYKEELNNQGGDQGNDHYDGALFVVQDSKILQRFRWSSYASREGTTAEEVSSIRGNEKYNIKSFLSPKKFINYAFLIESPGKTDKVNAARLYFGPKAANHTKDKGAIRFHYGNLQREGNGSEGCIVSPDFFKKRDLLIELYQREYNKYWTFNDPAGNNLRDDEVEKVHNKDLEASQKIWDYTKSHPNSPGPTPDMRLLKEDWDDKMAFNMYLIRPDERPVD